MILLMRSGFGKGMQRLQVDEQKRSGLQVSDLSDGPVLLDSTEAVTLNGDVAIASAKERKPSLFRFLPFSLSPPPHPLPFLPTSLPRSGPHCPSPVLRVATPPSPDNLQIRWIHLALCACVCLSFLQSTLLKRLVGELFGQVSGLEVPRIPDAPKQLGRCS